MSITTAQGEDVINIWQLTKDLLALLNPWVLFPLDKKLMGLMNLRAGHRHSSLVREESQPTVFPASLSRDTVTLKGRQGQIKGWFSHEPPPHAQECLPYSVQAHPQHGPVWARAGMELPILHVYGCKSSKLS